MEKYFEGQSNLDEERELKRYFTEEKDIPPDFLPSKVIFAHFESGQKIQYPTRRKLVINSFAVAASILLVAGIFILFRYATQNSPVSLVSQRNETEKVLEITLSNNDKLWLNKNCEVTYPKKIKANHNKITLNGEAYLEFIYSKSTYDVITNKTLLKTEKLTSFNIRATERKATTEITVDSGSVNVYEGLDPDGLAVFVKAGYYCSVHKSQKFVFTSAIRDVNYKSWKTGEFMFDGVPMATVASILSEYYNVQIELGNRQMAYCQFSGNFKEESLDHILNNIKSQLNLNITSTGDVITFSGENCF